MSVVKPAHFLLDPSTYFRLAVCFAIFFGPVTLGYVVKSYDLISAGILWLLFSSTVEACMRIVVSAFCLLMTLNGKRTSAGDFEWRRGSTVFELNVDWNSYRAVRHAPDLHYLRRHHEQIIRYFVILTLVVGMPLLAITFAVALISNYVSFKCLVREAGKS
ncbi:hypothetical protein [Herbaspirillum sp. RV1423]|uniref:hypothetical protein n=1 Tax=Herbaspirillum sp. RV1423 TaxID=1443993 RepID=UPI000552B231|nr:hypothetical protein [Herbaspirillum sp. RV1423]